MRVAMTGGGGFIGSHLLARLVGLGIDVTLVGPEIGRSRYTASLVTAGAVRFAQCDARFVEGEALRRTFEETDVLIMLGCMTPTSSSAVERLLDEIDVNLTPVARLLRVALAEGRHVIFASSDSVYGAPLRNPVRESDATIPRTPFAVAKLACEQAVRISCSALGATASILRYAAVYGPGETAARPVPDFIRAALAGHPPLVDDGLEERDYIHVADAVEATVAALRRRADGVYNVGTGIGTTTIELASLVVWLTGAKTAPARSSARESANDRTSLVLDTERARSDLGFTPRHSLPEGLTEEIGWFKAQLAGTLRTAA